MPMSTISRSAPGHVSRDSMLADLIGLFLLKAPSTKLYLLGPISMGSKKVDAAEVSLAASQILYMSYRALWRLET